MNTKLTIKNFRVFDEDGVTVDLKPITVLTGCNSSGKSSVVKAALMLNDVLRQLKDASADSNINDIKIDFTTYPNNLLGRFDKVLHNTNSGKITFEYTVYSYMISKDVTISLDFVADKSTKMNNAYLDNFKISIDDGVIFWIEKNIEEEKRRKDAKLKRLERYKAKTDKSIVADIVDYDLVSSIPVFKRKVNATLVKKDFFDYSVCRFLISLSYNNVDMWSMGERSFEDFKSTNEFVDKVFSECIEEYKISDDRLKDIAHSDADGVCKNGSDVTILDKINGKDTLFYIPVLDDLDKIGKNDFEKYVSENDFVGYMTKTLTTDIGTASVGGVKYSEIIADTCSKCNKEVVDAFMQSDATTFREYFNDLEFEYFDNADFPYLSEFGSVHYPNQTIMELWDGKSVFSKTYIVLMFWNQKNHSEQSKFYEKEIADVWTPGDEQFFSHKSVKLFGKFLKEFYKECMSPSFYGTMTYVSSSRATIKRLYQLDQKDDFTLLLKRYMESPEKGAFINKWIKKFGIGDSVSFDIDDDGVGVKIRIHKTVDDEKGRLLADEGYGITQLLSIMLQIEMSSVHDNQTKITLAVEEPEIHLHPRYQSLLADMFVDAYNALDFSIGDSGLKPKKHSKYAEMLADMHRDGFPHKNGIHFIIETHSEYLIRRLQLLVAGIETEKKLDKNEVSIAYIYTKDEAEKENQPLVKNISICEDGYLDDTFGSGFFDEATKLSRKLM